MQSRAKAKQVCCLNMEDIRMAEELGLSPKTLMKNQPSPSERWKLPVKLWIHELYAKRFGHDPAQRPAPKVHRPPSVEPSCRTTTTSHFESLLLTISMCGLRFCSMKIMEDVRNTQRSKA